MVVMWNWNSFSENTHLCLKSYRHFVSLTFWPRIYIARESHLVNTMTRLALASTECFARARERESVHIYDSQRSAMWHGNREHPVYCNCNGIWMTGRNWGFKSIIHLNICGSGIRISFHHTVTSSQHVLLVVIALPSFNRDCILNPLHFSLSLAVDVPSIDPIRA